MLGNETFSGERVRYCKKPALYECHIKREEEKEAKKKRIASEGDLRAI
jgi:hypothetical protein